MEFSVQLDSEPRVMYIKGTKYYCPHFNPTTTTLIIGWIIGSGVFILTLSKEGLNEFLKNQAHL